MELEKIKSIIEPILQQENVELYELNWSKMESNKVLQVAITKDDGGIDLDVCQSVSEKISEALDELDNFSENNFLEVCSAGAERRLRSLKEVESSIDAYVYAKLKNPIKGIDDVTGTIVSVNEDIITISYLDKTRKKSIELDYNNISLIRLAIKF